MICYSPFYNGEKAMPKTAKADNFEAQLHELEQLVKQLEDSQLPLAESLAAFERGVALSRQCQQLLDQAELKVQTLIQSESSNDE